MKSSKFVIALVIVLAALFGGGKYLEHRVVSGIRDTLVKNPDGKVGDISFSVFTRTLVLTDVQYTLAMEGEGPVSIKLERGEAVLPWGLVFNPSREGQQLVAESYALTNLNYSQDGVSGTIASDAAKGLSFDLGLAEKMFTDKEINPVDMAAMYERMGYESGMTTGIVFELGDGRMTIGLLGIENYEGLKVGRLTSEKIVFQLPNEDVELSIGLMEMNNVEIPPNAFRMMLEVSPEEFQSPVAVETFLKTLLGGKSPLFSRFTMKDTLLTVDEVPVSLASFDFDWASNMPLKYTSALTGIAVPAAAVEERAGIRLPGIEHIKIDTKTEINTSDEGVLTEYDSYQLDQLLDVEVRAAVISDDQSNVPITMMDAAAMMRLRVVEIEATITDKGLLGYYVLNDSPDATAEEIAQMAADALGDSAQPEKVQAITDYIRAPGTIRFSLKPDSPAPLMGLMMGMMGDPLSMIDVTVEQGTPLDETLARLHSLAQ